MYQRSFSFVVDSVWTGWKKESGIRGVSEVIIGYNGRLAVSMLECVDGCS